MLDPIGEFRHVCSLVPKLPLGNALLKSSALVWLQPTKHNPDTVHFARLMKPPFADLEKTGLIDYEHEHEHDDDARTIPLRTSPSRKSKYSFQIRGSTQMWEGSIV